METTLIEMLKDGKVELTFPTEAEARSNIVELKSRMNVAGHPVRIVRMANHLTVRSA